MGAKRGQVWRQIAVYVGLLVLIFVLVHLLWISHIRPTADAMIDAARAVGDAAPRSFYVVLRDLEQEVCIVLFVWTTLLALWRMWTLSAQWDYFDVLASASEGELAEAADNNQQPLITALTDSLARFRELGDLHEARETVRTHVDTLARTLEAENSLFRYVIWVVPSIGFIGTVRGIGTALGEADKALAGDIASMTASLGVAFNSTFVALLVSIVLMMLMHLLEGMQDKLVIDIESACEARLRLAARSHHADAGPAAAP